MPAKSTWHVPSCTPLMWTLPRGEMERERIMRFTAHVDRHVGMLVMEQAALGEEDEEGRRGAAQ